jgi:hypothetical protein
MNKEKWLAVAAFFLLLCMGWLAWRAIPELENLGEQRREGLRPLNAVPPGEFSDGIDLAASLNARDPFFWTGEEPLEPPPVLGNKRIPDPVRKPQPPPKEKPRQPAEIPPPPLPPQPPPKPIEKYKLPIEYVGVVKTENDEVRQVIFKDTASGEYLRLSEGQQHKGVTVLEVKANMVTVSNEKGEKFILPREE